MGWCAQAGFGAGRGTGSHAGGPYEVRVRGRGARSGQGWADTQVRPYEGWRAGGVMKYAPTTVS
ncbi:MAG TPA: hypothetical protein VF647_05565, partial [Longimicrobium sp.]